MGNVITNLRGENGNMEITLERKSHMLTKLRVGDLIITTDGEHLLVIYSEDDKEYPYSALNITTSTIIDSWNTLQSIVECSDLDIESVIPKEDLKLIVYK